MVHWTWQRCQILSFPKLTYVTWELESCNWCVLMTGRSIVVHPCRVRYVHMLYDSIYLWDVSMRVLPLARTCDRTFHSCRRAPGSIPVIRDMFTIMLYDNVYLWEVSMRVLPLARTCDSTFHSCCRAPGSIPVVWHVKVFTCEMSVWESCRWPAPVTEHSTVAAAPPDPSLSWAHPVIQRGDPQSEPRLCSTSSCSLHCKIHVTVYSFVLNILLYYLQDLSTCELVDEYIR